jgi:ABC-type Na+ efflux pump permease subunit
MDLATIQQVQRTHVPFADLNPKKEEGQERVSRVDVMRQWAPTAFVYLLWIAIFSIVQMLLNNAIEEKSNRIIEVLLSSVTPGELMMGKLAGIAAIGLTMVGTWIASFVGILFWKSGAQSELASISTEMFTILRTTHLVPAFLVYFVFGYLLYGGLIITIGSICNTLKEAQNYMGTIVLILMVPLMTMMFIPKDPNGTLATALSWVPIYTPFVMMNRAAADPPLFEVIGTMILLIATTLLVLWLSGKIFRIGILRTGQPPKLIELFRWLKG